MAKINTTLLTAEEKSRLALQMIARDARVHSLSHLSAELREILNAHEARCAFLDVQRERQEMVIQQNVLHF